MNSLKFLKQDSDLEQYVHPHALSKDWIEYVEMTGKNDVPLDLILTPVFSDKMCQELIEIGEEHGYKNYENALDYTKQDIMIKELPEWQQLVNRIIKKYVYRVVEHFWSNSHKANRYDTHFGFLLKYDAEGEMVESTPHNDGSQYTLLVCLNDGFDGGGTCYPAQNITVKPKKGYGCIHPVCNRRHGGQTITKGVRYIYSAFIGGS